MKISGRENYRRAIEFQGPAYLPAAIGCDINWIRERDEAKLARIRELQAKFPWDIMVSGSSGPSISEPTKENGVTRWIDEWGTGWEDDGHGGKTEIYPLEEGYHLLDSYKFPDPYSAGRFDRADKELKDTGGRYTKGSVWFTLFERLWMLRGFNNMLMDPYVDPVNFTRLRDRILEINLALIDQWVQRKVDAVYFSDDWGCQRGLLMNPDDWRKFYKPAYAAMFQRARGGGLHVWMHLCGDVSAIVPDLIEIGLSVLNPVQPQAMDVRQLSRDFGGKVCFWGGVDVQGTLIRGTPEDVKREVDDLVDLFGRFNGGYIAGTSHSVMPETPLDNVVAMYEAVLQYL
ncbi:MAG: uroporphyrinogen decarboxylase family protein [Armatimonadota bacterium]|nr:uroporphyrinogen decarboxylase family protein [Armatimonadota bacterium]